MNQILPPSYQSLLINMKFNDQLLATGTAFVIQKNHVFYLITNRHNVTGRSPHDDQPLSKTCGIPNQIEIMHNVECGENELRWEPKLEKLLDEDGNPLWHEHPTLGMKADFIALKLNNLQKVKIFPYSLDEMGNMQGIRAPLGMSPAKPVSVVGFPFGIQAGGSLAVWSTGFIASEMCVDFNELPVFLIDCRARQGQSGSAVIFHSDGGITSPGGGTISTGRPFTTLLGIYSGRINSESDLGIVWKTSAIRELVDAISI